MKVAKKEFKRKSSDEIRQEITNKMIDALKQGKSPWRRPWNMDPNCGFPRNIESKKLYRGVNPFLLEITALDNGFKSQWWATYKQWQGRGGQVRKGQKGTTVVFWSVLEVSDEKDANKKKKIFFLKHYVLFNLDQVDGDSLDKYRPVKEGELIADGHINWEPAEDIIKASNVVVKSGGNRAFYMRPTPDNSFPDHKDGDYIQMPHRRQFSEIRDYYDTIFHELTHWTEVRRKWNGAYAMGELIAEISSCFVSAQINVPQSECIENHQQYVLGWIKEMENDPKWIFRAAAEANKVADMLLGFAGLSDKTEIHEDDEE